MTIWNPKYECMGDEESEFCREKDLQKRLLIYIRMSLFIRKRWMIWVFYPET